MEDRHSPLGLSTADVSPLNIPPCFLTAYIPLYHITFTTKKAKCGKVEERKEDMYTQAHLEGGVIGYPRTFPP